ncbi:hypothetical protein SAZ11_04310 [Streptomyces sp. FXJ1.4098]|nr:hypothetical protein [Streptomyces sp. FXJ1.4098]
MVTPEYAVYAPDENDRVPTLTAAEHAYRYVPGVVATCAGGTAAAMAA